MQEVTAGREKNLQEQIERRLKVLLVVLVQPGYQEGTTESRIDLR